ncbi:MAG: ABC transporter ATP-binding protein [Enterobacter sp.]|uniref:ABC transporter ATP-binding protein n=1 Tax=Enterobacter sp. TaxID=42895 RepID=UPI00290938DA|nr:ABC transporter ATP-binding protein [Enterobacter sp.]MDU7154125.1 ABC transporter ATP-binding protein [Enterobacter sp.]
MTTIPLKDATPVLQVKNLNVTFAGSPVSVLDGISLTVRAGETLALVGESGCGKSITSLALMGLLPASARIVSGEMQFRRHDLRKLSPREYADLRGSELAMIFQEPMTSLNPAFTLGDQLSEAVMRHQDVSRAEAMKIALQILEKVQIPAAEMRTIQAQILALLNTLKEETGTAVLMITHDLGVVAEVAQQVAVMYAGQVVEQGSVEAIFADPQHPYTIGLMGSIPSLSARKGPLSTIPGSVPLPESMPQGCRFATRCPFAQSRCHDEKPPLTTLGAGHRVACFRVPLEHHIALGETA